MRNWSGDIDPNGDPRVILSDEEIDRELLATCGTLEPGEAGRHRTTAKVLFTLATRFFRMAEGSTSGPYPSRSRAQECRASARYELELAAACTAPVAGGMSVSELADSRADSDLVQPRYRLGMLDNPDA